MLAYEVSGKALEERICELFNSKLAKITKEEIYLGNDIIKIAICDDERVIIDRLRGYIEKHIKKAGLPYKIDIYQSGEEFAALEKAMSGYDIVFMDVNMKEMDGIKTAEDLRKYSDRTFLVFVTGFIEYSLAGYKVDAIRYIIKDETTIESDIVEALNVILEKMGRSVHELVYDFVEQREKKINIDNIVYIDNFLHRACFHLVENDMEKEYTVYKKLDDIEQEIKEEKFVRIHQSFIVNMDYVCDVKRYYAKLINGNELPVSKQRYKSVVCEYTKQRGKL